MSRKLPWVKWHFKDWRNEPALKLCSLAARGLWMEMLALMDEASPRGHLLVNGISPDQSQLAVLAGAPVDQVADLLAELEQAGVFSRDRNRVIYSRRMVFDEKKAKTARRNGKKGGNPNLCNNKDIPPSDNQKVEEEDKPPDKLRRKSQSKESESDISTSLRSVDIGAHDLFGDGGRGSAPPGKPKPQPMTDSFQPPPEWLVEAETKGNLTTAEVSTEWEEFQGYWLERAATRKGKKIDWRRTWINYVTGDICQKRVAARRRNAPGRQGAGGGVEDIASITLRSIARA